MDANLMEFRVSNDILGSPDALKSMLLEEGYLFFKRLIEPDQIGGLRSEILDLYRPHDWLLPGTDPLEGRVDRSKSCAEGEPPYLEVYQLLYGLRSFHAVAHAPELIATMEKLVGGEVLVHPSKVARMSFPQSDRHTTPIHQDFVHFQGSYHTLTCWTPLSDCPVELGGLAIHPRPWSDEIFGHHFSLGAGMLKIDEDQLSGSWHTTDYEVGDALIFHSLTVHKALPNETDEHIRISLDNRYQSASDVINDRQLQPHLSGGGTRWGWDSIYQEWPDNDDLAYYWNDMETRIVPWDDGFADKGVMDAIAKARNGDEDAIYSLKILLKANPGSKWAGQAAETLAAV